MFQGKSNKPCGKKKQTQKFTWHAVEYKTCKINFYVCILQVRIAKAKNYISHMSPVKIEKKPPSTPLLVLETTTILYEDMERRPTSEAMPYPFYLLNQFFPPTTLDKKRNAITCPASPGVLTHTKYTFHEGFHSRHVGPGEPNGHRVWFRCVGHMGSEVVVPGNTYYTLGNMPSAVYFVVVIASGSKLTINKWFRQLFVPISSISFPDATFGLLVPCWFRRFRTNFRPIREELLGNH